VAEEKKKDGDAKAEGAKKKKLPPIVMVALGAILGGAGVVFALPPKVVEKPVEPKVVPPVDVEHPDKMSFKFNPRTQAGKSFASLSFCFVYTVQDEKEPKDEAFELIKANWGRAKSRVLMLLKSRTPSDLNSENGQNILAADVMKELDKTLFDPLPGKERVARVTDVLWEDWILQ
jgi:flagellar basal body-associated protein FliL